MLVDDKRFLTGQGEDPKEEKPKRERIPIQLPEIEYPSHKEHLPEEEIKTPDEPKPEPPKETVVPPVAAPPEEFMQPQMTYARQAAGRRPLNKFWLVSSTLILAVSISWNVLLYYNMFELEKKLTSNTKIIDSALAEKEKILKEKNSLKESLQKEIAAIKMSVSADKESSVALKLENEELLAELDGYEEKYTDLETELQEYASEIEELTATRVGYYNAYNKEKANTKKMNLAIQVLETELAALRKKHGAIEEVTTEKELSYIYDMAFLYLRTGQIDKSIEGFKKYLELDATDANIYYNLGFIYEEIKEDRDMAIIYYSKYIELNPDAEDAYDVKLKIASLIRLDKAKEEPPKKFKINLDKLKY